MMRLAWGLLVIAAASTVGAAVIADLLVHAPSSLILRTLRQWSDVRYARKWGIPVDADAIRAFGMSEWEWREFADAHQVTAGGAS